MKTIEENAKVYTELINRLEDVKDAIKKHNYGIAMEILCKPYTPFQVITHSELKESEDEKIRNRIIERLKCMEVGSPTEIGEEVAWLKKRGNQKANVVVRRFLIGDTFIDKYYPTNVFTVTEYIENGIAYVDQSGERFTKYYDDSWDDYQLVEQKPSEWSEHQHKLLNYAISMTDDPEVKHFLESLRNADSNTSAAWSEEDKKALEVVTYIFERYGVHLLGYPAFVHWLKKLPERISFSPYWKPSDEQIMVLAKASETYCGIDKGVLYSLYNDLKKLK